MSVSAFVAEERDRVVIVAINRHTGNVEQPIELNGGDVSNLAPWVTSDTLTLEEQDPIDVDDSEFSVLLPARSVTTLVGDLEDANADADAG